MTASEASSLTVRTEEGRSVVVKPVEGAEYRKATPGATTLEGAAVIAISDIAVGDRVLARGALSEDGATLVARQVIVMAQAEIADKQQRERADWQRRGVVGVVTALDPEKKEITVQTRGTGAPQNLVITTAEKNAALKRYAPGSVKFSDATSGRFGDLAVGDQLRALGDRSADGTRLAAEQIISGSFRTIVGAIESVDVEKKLIHLADAGSSGTLAIRLAADTTLRRLPPEMAARMGARAGGPLGAAGPGAGSSEAGAAPSGDRPRRERPPVEGAPGEERRRGSGGANPTANEGGLRPGGPPNLGDLLERMPVLNLAELKAGDRIAISTARGADATALTALALVAGIEPLLAAASEGGSRRAGSGADLMPGLPAGALDMGMGMGGGF